MKNKTPYHFLLILSCLLFFPVSCTKSELTKLSYEEMVEKKFRKSINERLNICKDEAIANAEVKVDSIIDRLLTTDLIDTLDFPQKPVRPERPGQEKAEEEDPTNSLKKSSS